MELKINIDEPRYDQSTYWGRAKHFFSITNPLNLLASSKELDEAKTLVTKYRKGDSLPGITEDQLWRAKELYDSAFHPDTGEKMILIGRMSAQVPMNMTITGLMMTFYKSTPAVVFWQWANQSFNALVNYTNRSGSSSISNEQLLLCYAMGTGGALGTALTLNRLTKHARPLIGRLVPFAAVAAANCINVPMMRLTEIQEGIPVTDKSGKELGLSKTAAKQGIAIVTFSRIGMASPGMALTPVLMNFLESKGTLARYPWCGPPIQVAVLGLCLTFATPMCCAIFSQKMEKAVSDLEPELQAKINAMPNPPKEVYYNKGL